MENLKEIEEYFILNELKEFKDQKIPIENMEHSKMFKLVMFYLTK